MFNRKKVLLCGATGFVGRNILERLLERSGVALHALRHRTDPPAALIRDRRIRWLRGDLRRAETARCAVRGMDVVIQAAATTTGCKDTVQRPYHHVTDNAVMNSLLFRECHLAGVKQVVFFSCSVVYAECPRPVREADFNHRISDRYFGVGWTKAYLEKMCEFYSRLGRTRFTAIRHSNLYGPHDKFDLERSHVFGATVAKVMNARNGEIVVWGDGSETRDLLYVDDLVDFVETVMERQTASLEVINVGLGRSVSVKELVRKIVSASGVPLKIRFDASKPTVPFRLALNVERARRLYGWRPATSLEEGIRKTLAWYCGRLKLKK